MLTIVNFLAKSIFPSSILDKRLQHRSSDLWKEELNTRVPRTEVEIYGAPGDCRQCVP
jgi:hypothetical protein